MNEAISFKELGIVLCYASNKRKIKKPMFAKIRFEYIPLFYDNWGYIFRSEDNPRKYYNMEEFQELFINHANKLIKNGDTKNDN